jgi:hypothetical protein
VIASLEEFVIPHCKEFHVHTTIITGRSNSIAEGDTLSSLEEVKVAPKALAKEVIASLH